MAADSHEQNGVTVASSPEETPKDDVLLRFTALLTHIATKV